MIFVKKNLLSKSLRIIFDLFTWFNGIGKACIRIDVIKNARNVDYKLFRHTLQIQLWKIIIKTIIIVINEIQYYQIWSVKTV